MTFGPKSLKLNSRPVYCSRLIRYLKFYMSLNTYIFFQINQSILRLGAQSVTLFSTLRDPTQLRQRQCATTPLFCCTSEGRNRSTKKSTTSHRGWPTAKNVRNPLNSRKLFLAASCTFLGSIYSFLLMSNKNLSFLLSNIT